MLYSPSTGSALGMEVLRALGIDHKGVVSVSIGMQAEELAVVTIVRHVLDAEAPKIIEAVTRYALTEKPEDPAAKALDAIARNLGKVRA